MKILHVPFTYYPDAVGGTEVYVQSLARLQRDAGLQVMIAAPGAHTQQYEFDGLAVWRYPAQFAISRSDIYAHRNPAALAGFNHILDATKPDVLHIHALTPGINTAMVDAAKQRGIATVFTYHTATVSCFNDDMMEMGRKLCNGVISRQHCLPCRLNQMGTPAWLAKAIAQPLTKKLSALSQWFPPEARLRGLLDLGSNLDLFKQSVQEFMHRFDGLVAVCNWVRDVMLVNQCDPARLTVCRQGLRDDFAATPSRHQRTATLKLGCVARCIAMKGLDLVVDAVVGLPELDIELDIFCSFQSEFEFSYMTSLQQRSANNSKIRWHVGRSGTKMYERLAQLDVLAVPSRWAETGPLTVLEAHALKLPVLGSNIGGIAELVAPGVGGWLVEQTTVVCWQQAIRNIYSDLAARERVRASISPPRTMREVMQEHTSIYQHALARATQNQVNVLP
jgi:glycosyltransferase involved in cell wall biosynthesis